MIPTLTNQRPFLSAEWRNLVMLNYEVDPALLFGRVPNGCELDRWNGRTFVSVVGFQFFSTRVLGVSIPGHRNFEEVNLRYYVRRKHDDGSWRHGVVFVKELVPRWAIALVARGVYGENYVALRMRHRVTTAPNGSRSVAYEWWRRGRWDGVHATFTGDAVLPGKASEEAFITEHYWGYGGRGAGRSVEYHVEHARWKVWRATTASFSAEVASLYGAEFVDAVSGPPSTAFVADGSDVIVHHGRQL